MFMRINCCYCWISCQSTDERTQRLNSNYNFVNAIVEITTTIKKWSSSWMIICQPQTKRHYQAFNFNFQQISTKIHKENKRNLLHFCCLKTIIMENNFKRNFKHRFLCSKINMKKMFNLILKNNIYGICGCCFVVFGWLIKVSRVLHFTCKWLMI